MWAYAGDSACAEDKDAVVEGLHGGHSGGHRGKVRLRGTKQGAEHSVEVPPHATHVQLQWRTVIRTTEYIVHSLVVCV